MADTVSPDNKGTKSAGKKSNTKSVFVIGLVVLVVVGIIGYVSLFNALGRRSLSEATSGSIFDKFISSATNGNVDIDSSKGEITIKGPEGSEFTSKKSLPSDWPNSIMIVSPYEIVGSSKITNDGKTSWTVITTTTSSAATVKDDITNKYAGWTLESDNEYNGIVLRSYTNGTYKLNVIITPAGEDSDASKTTVTYTVTQN